MIKEIQYYSSDKNIILTNGVNENPGFDLKSSSRKEICIDPGKWAIIPTGISLNLPPNSEGQIRPRTGLALKYGITVLNSPGTIDKSYRGEIKIILINLSDSPFLVTYLDKIAQIVFSKVSRFDIQEVNNNFSVLDNQDKIISKGKDFRSKILKNPLE